MTTEELLQPRFKVLADYPFNQHFKVGEIVTLNKIDTDIEGTNLENKNIYFVRQAELYCGIVKTSSDFYEKGLQKYPHLFQQLYWYDERKVEDLPAYIKIKGEVKKVNKWEESLGGHNPVTRDGTGSNPMASDWFFNRKESMPATEEEFNLQQAHVPNTK